MCWFVDPALAAIAVVLPRIGLFQPYVIAALSIVDWPDINEWCK